MIDNGGISELEIALGENTKAMFVLKSFCGKLFIDVRKWIFFEGGAKPTRHGIVLSVDKWPEAIDKINALIKESN